MKWVIEQSSERMRGKNLNMIRSSDLQILKHILSQGKKAVRGCKYHMRLVLKTIEVRLKCSIIRKGMVIIWSLLE